MSKLRVLIIDDEEPVRRFLRRELDRDRILTVVGTAPDGATAISLVQQLKPDVVTLDIGMPDENGLDLLIRLKALRPNLHVVMFSGMSLDTQSLELVKLGADALVEKPARVATHEDLARHVQEHLVPRIKAVAGRPSAPRLSLPSERHALRPSVPRLSTPTAPHGPVPRPSFTSTALPDAPVDVLAIGSSAGGPDALATFFAMLPANLPVPVVLVQHMPANFTRLLAERLSLRSPLEFHEAKAGDVLAAGRVLVAPGDYHMRVERAHGRAVIALDQGPRVQSVRPAVDVLFRSVAEAYRGRCLAVVLTGMGRDGAEGCAHVRKHGGQVIVQDEASSLVWGMPGTIAEAGLANAVLPLQQLPSEVLRRTVRATGWATPASRT